MKMLTRLTFVFLALLSVAPKLTAQQTFFIKEASTKESVPFAKVYPNLGEPFLTDIDGQLTVSNSVTSVRISSHGFTDSTFVLAETKGSILYLSSKFQEIQEVVVLPGENPAHRIINLVIDKRKENNPMKSGAFRYNSYSKFITQVDPTSLANISDTTSDSTLLKIQSTSAKQHFFLIEQASVRTFFPPTLDREEVTAYKVSGSKDPLFTVLAKQMQSFSFYNNTFDILGKSYENPISPGGTNRYLFIIEDTTFVGTDTVFNISFRPRKGKRFDGLKGQLYINTAGYAIEKVIAEPNEEISGLRLKIIQEYAQIQPVKWFPKKLSSEIIFPNFISGDNKSLDLMLKSSNYIDSVDLNPDKTRWMRLNNENIVIQDEAVDKSETEWEKLRHFELSEKEKNTYHVVDSIAKEENLDFYFSMAKVLASGKVPLGYFNVNLKDVLNYNGYEGIRLGLGMETSKKLMKSATLGGYFAYGFKDKPIKHGGKLDVRLYQKKSVKLSLEYKDDVFERGGRIYPEENFSLANPRALRKLFINSMDKERVARATLSSYVTSNFKVSAFGSYNRLTLQDDYRYASELLPLTSNLDVGFMGVELYWRIREKVQIIDDYRFALSPTKYPVLFVRMEKSIPDFYESTANFSRLYTEISQNISLRGFGSFNYLISAGKTIGTSPLTYAQTVLNSKFSGRFNLSVPNTFETVISSEYYFSEQASLFTRLNFLPFGKLGKNSEPQLTLHHAIGFGNRVTSGEHVLPANYKGMEDGYFEAGILLNNVYISGFSGIGVGVFHNYGPNSEPNIAKNLVFKLTLSPTF